MPSPFPGMDPYLESPAFWLDFHATFINYWREAVADALPPAYWARIGERVYLVEQPPVQRRLIYPDVAVTRQNGSAAPAGSGSIAVATLEPMTIPLVIPDEARETYIEILYRPDETLIAVLELLSPANKEEPGRSDYLAKRNRLVRQEVHLAELDLLRSGQRLPLQQPLPSGDFYYLLSRSDRRPDCQVFSWTIRDRQPVLPVPLRAPDADILIDFATIFATAYQRGRYRNQIDYTAPPPGTFRPEDNDWVAQQVVRARDAAP